MQSLTPSLIEQAAGIAELGRRMEAIRVAPCPMCAKGLCFWHNTDLIKSRRMTRAQWLALGHEMRERAREREIQDQREEDFRETYGYAMPYSMRLAAGHEVEEADSE